MGDHESHDRRPAHRFSARMPLDVSGAKAKLTDMTDTGVAFVTAEPFEPGMRVEISVRHLPDDRHPAPAHAQVVRVEMQDGLYEVDARKGDYTRRATPAVDVYRRIIKAGGVTPELMEQYPAPGAKTGQ